MKHITRLAAAIDPLYRKLKDIEKFTLIKHLPQGVTLGDVRVLRAVEQVGSSGVSAIAGFLGTSQPAATVAIARLEGRGLVARELNSTDGRRKALALTPKGKQIEQSHATADIDTAEMLLAGVSKEEQSHFAELLIQFATHESSRASSLERLDSSAEPIQ